MLAAALCLLLAAAEPFRPAIWPEYLGEWKRVSAEPVEVTDEVYLDDYGLQAAERAEYTIGELRMTTTGYRFRDAIAGYAAYLDLRPADAVTSDFDDIAVKSGESVFVLFGNYVFRFDGGLPAYTVYEELLAYVPKLDLTTISQLKDALPEGHVANSERYIMGPLSLTRFFPRVPPSVAAFRLGAHAMVARYGNEELAVFSYPTKAPASAQCAQFEKLPGASVRCEGPYVAVVFDAGEDAKQALAAFREPAPPVSKRPQPPPPGAGYFSAAVAGVVIAVGLGIGIWMRRRLAQRAGVDPEIRLKL
ncbi:MAG: hypothetical protein ACM3ZB_14440 [bacterium]|jgi:hypothetical protein